MSDPKTTIDWLCFRTKVEPREAIEALRGMYGECGSWLNLKPLAHGLHGWQRGCSIDVGGSSGETGLQLGRVDFGGDAMRGWTRVILSGQGCQWVRDWTAAQELEALPMAEIRRVDVALTTWEGEVGHETIEAAHGAGLFTCGGRPPDLQTILSSNPRAGRTCNVGSRKAGKFFRGYEKGLELASKHGQDADSVTHIDGYLVEDIYRCELELKAKDQIIIPWEVIERRDQYFGGSYPFLAELLPDVECDILMRRPERAPQTDLIAALANCRHQWGATLYTALHAYHGDIGAVWDQIIGRQHNPSLLAAGVLLVDHDDRRVEARRGSGNRGAVSMSS
jgi:DNA relaxase NicK